MGATLAAKGGQWSPALWARPIHPRWEHEQTQEPRKETWRPLSPLAAAHPSDPTAQKRNMKGAHSWPWPTHTPKSPKRMKGAAALLSDPEKKEIQREPSFLAADHPSDPGSQKGNMKGDPISLPRPTHPIQDPERKKHTRSPTGAQLLGRGPSINTSPTSWPRPIHPIQGSPKRIQLLGRGPPIRMNQPKPPKTKHEWSLVMGATLALATKEGQWSPAWRARPIRSGSTNRPKPQKRKMKGAQPLATAHPSAQEPKKDTWSPMPGKLLDRGPPIRPRKKEIWRESNASPSSWPRTTHPTQEPRKEIWKEINGSPTSMSRPIRPRTQKGRNMKGAQQEPSFLAAAHPFDPGAQKGEERSPIRVQLHDRDPPIRSGSPERRKYEGSPTGSQLLGSARKKET